MTPLLIQAAPTPAPPAPAAPQAPAARTGALSTGPGGAVHRYTASDIAALRARKAELSSQLNSADSRRREVQRSLHGAVGADKAGLEQRLGVLDARIARLEQDIEENSGQLASLDVARQTSSMTGMPHWGPDTGNRFENNTAPIGILFVLFVLSPIAFTLSRAIWKRGSRPMATAAPAETTQRLERIEQAIDSIAIEVERVSEGQRFVTRLMSDGRAAMPGGGQPAMEPVQVGDAQAAERR